MVVHLLQLKCSMISQNECGSNFIYFPYQVKKFDKQLGSRVGQKRDWRSRSGETWPDRDLNFFHPETFSGFGFQKLFQWWSWTRRPGRGPQEHLQEQAFLHLLNFSHRSSPSQDYFFQHYYGQWWWWSCGQSGCLLLWLSKFETWYTVILLREKNGNRQKEARIGPFVKKTTNRNDLFLT